MMKFLFINFQSYKCKFNCYDAGNRTHWPFFEAQVDVQDEWASKATPRLLNYGVYVLYAHIDVVAAKP